MLRHIFARLILPIALAAGLVAYVGLPQIESLLARWFEADVQRSARLLMNSIQEPLASLIERQDAAGLDAYLARTAADAHLTGVLVCSARGTTIARSNHTPASIGCAQGARGAVAASVQTSAGPALVSSFALTSAREPDARVLIAQNLGFVGERKLVARRYFLSLAAIAALTLGALIVCGAWLLVKRWVHVLVRDIRDRRFLDDAYSPRVSDPILSQVREVLRQVEASQRLEIDFNENWTPRALQQVVRDHLGAPQMMVVSNREPYVHSRGEDGTVAVQLPASGMVTALEPVMRACSGTWVAHGSGSADRETVDRHDRLRVPPDSPAYTLRRVWLTAQEEAGYYCGFANEGLWPLCHLAYVRPAFRESDWRMYEQVNRKFAEVVARESSARGPVVLIQDYHFALLPALVRERLPAATVVLFWHIPWPSAEAFGVCPWKCEMLRHMLAADILGFHTRHHCQNFLETVDRYMECQLDRESMTVTLQGHVCHVTPYPISIEWPPRWLATLPVVEDARRRVRAHYGIGPDVQLGLGVERWDFTKGIIERFHALETLLTREPRLKGRIALLQVASPSRSTLPAYQTLQRQTLAEAERINSQFATSTWRPIVLVDEHQPPERVFELYRAADFCLVNSLHDGMNLVAKEFVAARDDEDGVLILSTFAGASRELVEALLVNPFDIAATAAAIASALEMPRGERRERMRLMRRTVKENNVYRWAGRMLMDAARIRQRQALTRADHPVRAPRADAA